MDEKVSTLLDYLFKSGILAVLLYFVYCKALRLWINTFSQLKFRINVNDIHITDKKMGITILFISLLLSLLISITLIFSNVILIYCITILFFPLFFCINIFYHMPSMVIGIFDAVIFSHVVAYLYSIAFAWILSNIHVSHHIQATKSLFAFLPYAISLMFILLVYIKKSIEHNGIKYRNLYKFSTDSITRYEYLTLFLALAIIVLASSYICNRPKLIGDMFIHAKLAEYIITKKRIITNYIPSFELAVSLLRVFTNNENFFRLSFIMHLPYEALIIALAFYLFAYSILLHSELHDKVKSLAALTSLILYPQLGLGVLMFIMLLLFKLKDIVQGNLFYNIYTIATYISSKTYDLFDCRQLVLPDIVAPFWFVGVPMVFYALYLINVLIHKDYMVDKRFVIINNMKLYVTFIALALTTPYMFIFLLGYITISMMVNYINGKTNEFDFMNTYKRLLILSFTALTIALSILTYFEISHTYKFMLAPLSTTGGNTLQIYLGLMFLLLIFLSFFNLRKLTKGIQKYIKFLVRRIGTYGQGYIRIIKIMVVTYIIVSFLLYVISFNHLNASALLHCLELDPLSLTCRNVSLGYYIEPWFLLPIRYGPLLIIFLYLIATNFASVLSSNRLIISNVIFVLFLLLVEASSYFTFEFGVYIPIYRLSFITHSIMCVYVSYELLRRLFNSVDNIYIHLTKILLLYALISLIVYYFVILIAFY